MSASHSLCADLSVDQLLVWVYVTDYSCLCKFSQLFMVVCVFGLLIVVACVDLVG